MLNGYIVDSSPIFIVCTIVVTNSRSPRNRKSKEKRYKPPGQNGNYNWLDRYATPMFSDFHDVANYNSSTKIRKISLHKEFIDRNFAVSQHYKTVPRLFLFLAFVVYQVT